jgi:hypothetical protein
MKISTWPDNLSVEFSSSQKAFTIAFPVRAGASECLINQSPKKKMQ